MPTLLDRARLMGTPLVSGATATFVWRGRTAPKLIGDFNQWGWPAMLDLRPAGPGVWARRLRLPRDAYMEYAYAWPGEPPRRVRDPLNPRTVPNGLGDTNHYFYMPAAGPTPLAQRQRGVPRGTVTRHVLEVPYGFLPTRRRTVHLYRPPEPGPWPLIVVYDGPDYLQRGRLPVIVDNLIAQRRMRPLALAMVANGRQARFVEYACSEATLYFVLGQVLPLAQAELDLVDPAAAPGAYGVLGASMGGLMAVYTGLRRPDLFGQVLSQSGAFANQQTETVVFDLVRDGARRDLKIWLDLAEFDLAPLAEANPRLRDLLGERGYAARYWHHNGGHNYTSWRNHVWRGLEWLFPFETGARR